MPHFKQWSRAFVAENSCLMQLYETKQSLICSILKSYTIQDQELVRRTSDDNTNSSDFDVVQWNANLTSARSPALHQYCSQVEPIGSSPLPVDKTVVEQR